MRRWEPGAPEPGSQALSSGGSRPFTKANTDFCQLEEAPEKTAVELRWMSRTFLGREGARASQAEGRRSRGLEVGRTWHIQGLLLVGMAGMKKIARD